MFKDNDEMDFEDFKRNLSKDPMGEYEQDELLESVRKNFLRRFVLNMIYFLIFLVIVTAILKFLAIGFWTFVGIALLFFIFKGLIK